MFRKLILSAVITATTLTALTATPSSADARPALLPHHRFEVLAERGGVWQSYGVYRLHAEAELVAIRLRHRGFHVEIRQF